MTERWPATFDVGAFTPEIYSARRMPDRVHYRVVECDSCGLVRSDPVLDDDVVSVLYAQSTFDYDDELEGLRATYGAALARLEGCVQNRDGILDIGCGNGFVLKVALDRGWKNVRGVEPSAHAIEQASNPVRDGIVEDVMREGLFEPESLDAVTLFQVLDHIADPVGLLRACHRALRPGGAILAFNHNVTAWSAKLLGERSPIVDIEHTYLYDPETMRRLFAKAGFVDIAVEPVRNTYSIAYLAQLVPLPGSLKTRAIDWLRSGRFGRRQLTVPLGNLCLIARRAG
ncbi:MAG: class I SAM-dependent methyltransferase [Thermoleophilia bacterium]|nr:class I SAM-dependent methyltransferase [Thermoleophilia bacterium]